MPERDLLHAKHSYEDKDYEWACFAAHQSAEKAVKAVYQKLGIDVWRHSVTELLKGLKNKIDIQEDLLKFSKYLDKFYIPTRYPNGWAEGIPADYITEEEVENAISFAEKILQFCKNVLDR